MLRTRIVAPVLASLVTCQGAAMTNSEPGRTTIRSPEATAASMSCGHPILVEVSGRANIFGAGIAGLPAPGGGGGGVPPSCIALPAGIRALRFARVVGSVSFVGPRSNRGGVAHRCAGGTEHGNPVFGPDGEPTEAVCGYPPDGGTIDPAGVVSGISSSDRVGFLTGVFLSSTPGITPLSALDVDGRYDDPVIRPGLSQLFFIGDGRTSDGSIQRFVAPGRGTRLFLGIADAYSFRGPPGFYDDNTGSFRVQVARR